MSTKALRAMIESVGKQWSLSPEGRAALADVGRELTAIEAAADALRLSGEIEAIAKKGLVIAAATFESIAKERP